MHQSQVNEIYISSSVMRTINNLPDAMRGNVVSAIKCRLFGGEEPANEMSGLEAAACMMICDTIMRESYRHAQA